MIKMKEIGAVIRTLRERQNETQRETAGAAGVSQSYLALIEAGERVPMLPVLDQLCENLGGELVVQVLPAKRASKEPAKPPTEDELFLAEVAAILPHVRDPVERRVLLRDLQKAAEREQERRQSS